MSNIAFYKAPDKVSLSGNEMLFKIITNNAWQSTWQNNAGIFIGWLKLSANYNENVIVKFTWGNKEVVFTCKDVPDDSGNQFPSRAIVGSEVEPPESYYQTILEYFSKNVSLIEAIAELYRLNPAGIVSAISKV